MYILLSRGGTVDGTCIRTEPSRYRPVPAPGHLTWGGLYDSRGGYRGGGGILYKTRRQILIEWIIIVAFLTHHI